MDPTFILNDRNVQDRLFYLVESYILSPVLDVSNKMNVTFDSEVNYCDVKFITDESSTSVSM